MNPGRMEGVALRTNSGNPCLITKHIRLRRGFDRVRVRRQG